MKQIDKDVLTIMLVHEFIKPSGKEIGDVVPNFNKNALKKLSSSLSFMSSERAAEETLFKLAQEAYKRLEKKLNK